MWVSEETLADFQERIEQLEASNRIRGANCADLTQRVLHAEVHVAVLKSASHRKINELIGEAVRIANELDAEMHDGQADQ